MMEPNYQISGDIRTGAARVTLDYAEWSEFLRLHRALVAAAHEVDDDASTRDYADGAETVGTPVLNVLRAALSAQED